MSNVPQSFGGGAYGVNPFGTNGSPVLQGAIATCENVVRLYFSVLPYFSGLLDPSDAGLPAHYSIDVVAGTIDALGQPVRPVGILFVTQGEDTNTIDLFLDRPLSSAPASYTVTTLGLVVGPPPLPGVPTPIANGSATFQGCYRELVTDGALPARDLANPQTASDQTTASPLLGTFVVDDSGDYAPDDGGLASYKKRILRRGITRKNGFAHLPGYGVGIPSYGKKLQKASTRARIAADYEAQIRLEPETLAVSVTSAQSPTDPGLVFFIVQAETTLGSTRFALPFSAV